MRIPPLARRVLNRKGAGPSPMTVVAQLDESEALLIAECRPHTMVSPERLIANVDAVSYAVQRGIPGAIVECGVWRGGSTLAMVLALQRLGIGDRDIYLYDTFEGMTTPTVEDTSPFDGAASTIFQHAQARGERAFHGLFGEGAFNVDDVRNLLARTGYPSERIHLVVGAVEDTIPHTMPADIAVLRLDTDWYASTRHELEHLYPRVSHGGVLIIDDYGHWDGARRAVDEYFAQHGSRPLFGRTDYAGRMGINCH